MSRQLWVKSTDLRSHQDNINFENFARNLQSAQCKKSKKLLEVLLSIMYVFCEIVLYCSLPIDPISAVASA